MMNKIHVYSNTRRLPLLFIAIFTTILFSISPALAEEPAPEPSPTPTETATPVEPTTTVVNNEYFLSDPISLTNEQFYSILFVLTLNAGLLLANFIVTHTKPISLGRL